MTNAVRSSPRRSSWAPGLRLLAITGLVCASWAVQAHDSWLSVATPPRPLPGRTVLALSTGALFPVQETAIAPEYLRAQGCRALLPAALPANTPSAAPGEAPAAAAASAPAPAAQPLVVLGLVDTALLLAVPSALAAPDVPAAPLSCWLQTSAFELDLTLNLVPVYLDEVRPGPEILAAWKRMRARGLPWRERYVKHARIELPGPAPGAGQPLAQRLAPERTGAEAERRVPQPARNATDRRVPQPAPIGLDLVLDDDPRLLRTDRPFSARLLRDGQPLAGHAVELRNERLALGIWLQTDGEGRVHGRLPLAGHWLVRAIDLRLSTEVADTFDSRFITLALTVAAAPAPSLLASPKP